MEKNADRSIPIGGSTITQQLAKNLYLSPERSYLRKLRELLIAFSLEDHLTKTRILELYLNVVEWGDGVFGAEAAAHHWFHHSASALSPAEAARLAIALPNPITRAPDVSDPELTKKAVRIIRLFRMQGLIDAEEERVALDAVGAPDAKVLPDHLVVEHPGASVDAGVVEIDAAMPVTAPEHESIDAAEAPAEMPADAAEGPVTSPTETSSPP